MIFKKAIRSRGDDAEDRALKHLRNARLKLIDRNFRSRYGEIDLIMSEKDTLVFIEVRYRKNSEHGSPLESVNYRKQERIRTTAQFFLQKNQIGESRPMRFDVVGILPNEITWVKNAF